MKKVKTIALIAHDNKKAEMVSWAMKNRSVLENFTLCGTGTTSKLVAEATGLDITRYLSGPLGGDQQIGAKIAEGDIDLVVFFWDPLQAQPHDPDHQQGNGGIHHAFHAVVSAPQASAGVLARSA